MSQRVEISRRKVPEFARLGAVDRVTDLGSRRLHAEMLPIAVVRLAHAIFGGSLRAADK
jgi:hypothetical protein